MFWKFIKPNTALICNLCLCVVIVSCKDFEDCKTAHATHRSVVSIELIGSSALNLDSIVSGSGFNQQLQDIGSSKKFFIPLNPGSDSITFLFYRHAPNKVDTITFFYKDIFFLISPKCGISKQYVLDSLQSTFSSYAIVNSLLIVTGDSRANVKVYY